MIKHKGRQKHRVDKIPEAVEKTVESPPREELIGALADDMLDALNRKIEKYDLTFEEALHATDIVHLSIVAKYIDFKIDMKFDEFGKPDKKVGIA